jgi:hypothetical protein
MYSTCHQSNKSLFQKFIRNLTEKEIQDFFNGNSAILASGSIDPEHLDLLPYDKKYEIDKDDIDLGKNFTKSLNTFSI